MWPLYWIESQSFFLELPLFTIQIFDCVFAQEDTSKVCDFGLARGIRGNEDYLLTEYVVTRWYRAPEVMVSCQEYDYKIDVWAVGCILAELVGRQPLFPGNDYIQQMNLIFNVLVSTRCAALLLLLSLLLCFLMPPIHSYPPIAPRFAGHPKAGRDGLRDE